MRRLAAAALLAGLAAGCASHPPVKRERTMMTPAQIADLGLVCRDMKRVDSIIHRSICANPRAWEHYDGITGLVAEDVFRQIRSVPHR